jgi:hypothetical protein
VPSFHRFDDEQQHFVGIISPAAELLEDGIVYVSARGLSVFIGSPR